MSLSIDKYKNEVVPVLKKELGTDSAMRIPTIKKIVINTCMSEAVQNPKVVNTAIEQLTAITGQKAVPTKAKKAIANFKLREGMPLGARVTLRRENMWSFFDKLVHLALPQVRDFRGLSPKGFDGRGNYNMGIKEQIIFPEISYDKVDKVRGMNITICTSADNDAEARSLLTHLGMPFKNR
jgi:large subunit ribosomal protein L5